MVVSAIPSQSRPPFTTRVGNSASQGGSSAGSSIGGAFSLCMAARTSGHTSGQEHLLHWHIFIHLLWDWFVCFFHAWFFSNNSPWYVWNLITFRNCVKMSAYRLVMDCWLQEFTQRLGIHHLLFAWCGKASESNNIFTFPWLINWPFKNFLKLLSKTKFCTWGTERFLSCVLSG